MSYTDEDIDAAVAEGALAVEAAAALRAFVARREASAPADEESFRLLTGFNDIFVGIATVMALGALGWLCVRFWPDGAGLGVALAAWALAEFFTRVRRMALPSILLLFAFVGGTVALAFTALPTPHTMTQNIAHALTVGLVGAVAALLHWLRFKVPVTVAAGTFALGAAGVAVVGVVTESEKAGLTATLVGGLAAFALALWWDTSDPARKSRRADVAFWLHLLAAPAIAHPLFALLGLSPGPGWYFSSPEEDVTPFFATAHPLLASSGAIAIYALLGLVALIVDRRALMVSGLLYLIYAAYSALNVTGATEVSFAAAALIVGAGLLLLSAFWAAARRILLRAVPSGWRARLPPAA